MLIRRRPSALRIIALAVASVAALAVVLGATLSAAQAASVGKLTQFPVPEPSDVAVDEAGIVWFAATSDQAIGRLDPATGNATLTQTDTFVPRGITVAADGDVWFSACFVPQGVGELDPDTNDAREFPLTDNPGPQDIAASPDGSVWFTQTTEGNIARITDVGVVTEGRVVKNSEPFGITVEPNGAPWYAMLEASVDSRKCCLNMH